MFVKFDETSVGRLGVDERTVSLGFKAGSDVNGSAFTTAGAQATLKGRPVFGEGIDGDVVEFAGLSGVQFSRGELLVDLKTAHESQLVRVQLRRPVNIAHGFIGHVLAKRSPFMSTTLD